MAAAIIILFRGKYGWGFPVGSFRPCFLCLTVVLPNNPNPVQYPLDYKCGLGLVGYTGTALTTQLVVNSGTTPNTQEWSSKPPLPMPYLYGSLTKNGTTSAGKPGNDAPTAGS